MRNRWTLPENEDRLRKAVADSETIAEVCRMLGIAAKGGNYKTIKYHVSRLNLDISHHKGQAWKRETYSEPDSRRNKNTIKAALIRKYGHICWECDLSTWNGKPIPLEMDHINGENNDNRLDNLRILCCNCHALTPTYRNRKRISSERGANG